jgi:parallel beta-helix repeat protein
MSLAARAIAILAIVSIFALPAAPTALGARVNVHCGDTITKNTTLHRHLVDCPGDGLVVGAADITIDLNGHRITGSGHGYGIRNSGSPKSPPCAQDDCWPAAGFPGVTVENGAVAGFANAIYAVGDHGTFRRLHVGGTLAACCYGKNNSRIPVDVRVLNSRVEGWIQGGADGLVGGNRVEGGNLGVMGGRVARNVVVRTASGGGWVAQGQMYRTHLGAGPIVVTGNVIRGGGVSVPASPSAQVDHNDIYGGVYATHLDEQSAPLSISANRIHSSNENGVWITGDWRSTVTGNRIYGNAANGIYLAGGCASVTGNRVFGNALNGIDATGPRCPQGRQFTDNSISGNGADGLYVADNHAPIEIEGNFARHNGGDGIHVDRSAGAEANGFWSSDGQRVVFQDSHGLSWDIYAANGDGTGVTQLTRDPGQDTKPQWSPDGSMIAFVSDRGGSLGLYVMNPDGGGVAKLAPLDSDKGFAWSLDSRSILFGDDYLWSVRADGSDLTTLTEARLVSHPRWTLDGSKIVFEAGPWFPTIEMTTYITNADGTGLRQADLDTDFPEGTIGGPDRTGRTVTADVLVNPFVTLAHNTANRNKGLGIETVPGVIDGGGNHAKRNGNPEQCVAPSLCNSSRK